MKQLFIEWFYSTDRSHCILQLCSSVNICVDLDASPVRQPMKLNPYFSIFSKLIKNVIKMQKINQIL